MLTVYCLPPRGQSPGTSVEGVGVRGSVYCALPLQT